MRIRNIIIIIQIIKNIIKSEYVEGCKIGNYCGSKACSENGFCNYNLSHYYNETFSVGGPHYNLICQCYMGYSSYDIEVQHINDRYIYCCYKKKSQLTAFYLELFIGFGIGHFYIDNVHFGLIKFFSQILLCLIFWCVLIHSCKKEHTIIINLNDMNRKEDVNFNKIIKNNKEINDINDIKEIKEIKEVNEEEDENIFEEKSNNDNNIEKNTNYDESKNQSFNDFDDEDNEENKINQLLSENLIQCPVSKFFIIMAAIAYIFFHIADLFFLGFGLHRDKNGEDLFLWN